MAYVVDGDVLDDMFEIIIDNHKINNFVVHSSSFVHVFLNFTTIIWSILTVIIV